MGMYGIKNFDAVINPPQGMIMAIGAGEKRPYVIDDALQIATIMSATGSFDHRAIDGADGARQMKRFKGIGGGAAGDAGVNGQAARTACDRVANLVGRFRAVERLVDPEWPDSVTAGLSTPLSDLGCSCSFPACCSRC